MLLPTSSETTRRCSVIAAVLACIAEGKVIKLPDLEPGSGNVENDTALLALDVLSSEYGGTVGEYAYVFEGEEDLLHLTIMRNDRGELSPEDGQLVAGFVLDGVPPGLVWFKPGRRSQHFFVGHDELPNAIAR